MPRVAEAAPPLITTGAPSARPSIGPTISVSPAATPAVMETAKAVLRARLWEVTQLALDGKRAYERRQQVGSGMRGDKIRTIRVRDDVVNDHVTGKQWRFKDYERGNW